MKGSSCLLGTVLFLHKVIVEDIPIRLQYINWCASTHYC